MALPSYYVQKMFSTNRGDLVLGLDFEAPVVKSPLKGGAIGVGTWATQAEFKDIKVAQGDKVLFQSDFSKGLKGWRTHQGHWHVKDGALQQTELKDDVRAIAGDKSWKDYTLTLKARKLGGGRRLLDPLQRAGRERQESGGTSAAGATCGTAWRLDGVNRHRPWTAASRRAAGMTSRSRTIDNRIRCYLDGKLIHDARRGSMDSMYAVASRVAEKRRRDPQDRQCRRRRRRTCGFRSPGLTGKVKSGTVTVLASADPMDENSLDNPNKVVPKESPLADAGANFVHSFPGNSVSVIRLDVE